MKSIAECETRARLIEVAGQIFAEKGFKATTIRDIVERAGANLAAVNYHFRDKEGLYTEALAHGLRASLARYPADGGVPVTAHPAERLRGSVRAFLQRALGCEKPSWHGQLMAREMGSPSPALLTLIDEIFRPVARHLQNLLAELNPRATEEQQWLTTQSIIANCHFFRHAEAYLARDRQAWAELDLQQRIELLTEHILTMTLRGLAAYP